MTQLRQLAVYLGRRLLGCQVRRLIAPGYPVIRPPQNTVWLDDFVLSPVYW